MLDPVIARSTPELFLDLGTALAAGLLVGAVRERGDPRPVTAGLRTFALVALLGALVPLITPVAGGVLLATAGALAVVSGLRGLRDPAEAGLTTEVALLVTAGIGVLVGQRADVAAGLAVVTAVLLAGKHEMHRFVRNTVSDIEMQDALRFAVVALIVLPLLPSGETAALGGLDPHRLWLLVVLVTGVGWVAYVAVRVLGTSRGLLVAALAGGFVSGAATTGAMAGRARDPALRRPALAAICLVSVATLVQLLVVVAAAAPHLVQRFVPAVVVGTAVLLAEAWLLAGRRPGHRSRRVPDVGPGAEPMPDAEPVAGTEPAAGAGAPAPAGSSAGRPFTLRPALVLAVVISAVTLAARGLAAVFGGTGVLVAGALGGLVDAHAAALSVVTLATTGQVSVDSAVLATVAGLGTNTVVKIGLAAASGGVQIAARTALLLLPAAAAVLAAVLFLH